MNKPHLFRLKKSAMLLAAAGLAVSAAPAFAAFDFLGVAAGDVSSHDAIVWTRGVDAAAPAATSLTVDISTDPGFSSFTSLSGSTDAAKDYTLKLNVPGLQANTVYYYRFENGGVFSNVGRFKTAPDANSQVPVHFAFSGDMDGLMRPYALASVLPGLNLDFYVNLGDVIYENASKVLGNNAAAYLNSPSVTLSGAIPTPSATGATQAQLFADYSKKYREQFLPVNTGGQNGLKDFFAAQGNYTLYDNHELGNKQYINGGAPAGGVVGDMATGAGVDARVSANDVNTSATDYINKAPGFGILQQVYLNYQPIKEDRAAGGLINAPADPRTNGTKQLYFAQQWGKNAIYINVDDRAYRDIRMKTSTNADDTTTRADNAGRTMLGQTQLAWLQQTLLDAQTAGAKWKFIAVSDPIDQIGPIGGALTLNNQPSYGTGSTYAPVSADGGKAWVGGYRAERNALLKFIADHQIDNVVFLATDDHQNRINELTYSPTGQTGVQSSYVKVPYAFAVVAGPLGATGPDLITNHTFSMAQQLADSIYNAQLAAGVEPLGLIGYPGLKNVFRENDPNAATTPSAVDFYSPDTFNFNTLDVSADGATLSVASTGVTATAQNSALEYGANGNTARTIFSFQVDAAGKPSVSQGGYVLNRRTGKLNQQIVVSNNGAAPLVGPIRVALDNLSANTALTNGSGVTVNNLPASPYINLSNADLAPGASVAVTLEFNKPAGGSVSYAARVIKGTLAP